jgi:hypothetical protein
MAAEAFPWNALIPKIFIVMILYCLWFFSCEG